MTTIEEADKEKQFMWNKDQAIALINELWQGCEIYGYFIAMTGSVLKTGVSDNDLDLVLYLKHNVQDDYRPALQHIEKIARATEVKCYDWKNGNHKLVFLMRMFNDQILNIFVPNFSFDGKLPDTYAVVPKSGDKS